MTNGYYAILQKVRCPDCVGVSWFTYGSVPCFVCGKLGTVTAHLYPADMAPPESKVYVTPEGLEVLVKPDDPAWDDTDDEDLYPRSEEQAWAEWVDRTAAT